MLFLLLILQINAIEFNQSLGKREITCFGDSLTEGLTVIGEISSTIKDFSIKIYNPMRFKKEGYLHQSQNELIQQFKFKVKYNHNIQICIQNLSTSTILYSLKYSQDNEEQSQKIDTQLPMTQLQPVENLMAQMKISYDIIKGMFSSLSERQDQRLQQLQQLGYRIVISSIVLLLVTVLITVFGTYRYKKVMKSKKMI
ncbi:unnamed protein product (macronuclear) [Paramecium tetraurelia]|uniref:GOLD domain-containing protein n=1 Tax=Paramecium tetraurelia TaxID=5888 RepID=A0CWC1_PARTE|nr:uncharacterized protein GSPATT00001290001 [Paramecium tetraurelia]CAK75088.1 unnamed protein product [Paramecium tetraurelia]|eukprot:XP_001442485.1 hypothetical protein (macronuclear) [Paramecium tetraurelia strain d4-2]